MKNGSTPLHLAAQEGHSSICRLIMHQMVDKNPANGFGITPLHYAAEEGHIAVCRLLIWQVEDKNPPDN